MTAPTLGARYLAACVRLGAEEWCAGMCERCREADYWGITGYAVDGEVPDLSGAATIGAALAVYDAVRGRSAPDPVYLAATVYGLTAPETQLALVEALERLAAERGAGAGGAA
jgi:hypothetical protein